MKCLALAGIELLDLKCNSYQFIMEEGEASQFNLMMEIISIFSLISLLTTQSSMHPATPSSLSGDLYYYKHQIRILTPGIVPDLLNLLYFLVEVFFPKTMTNQNQPGVLHHFLMRNLICFSFLQSSLLRSP